MRILTALLASAMMVFAANAYAADTDDVKAAITAYHAALESLDAAKMAALWAQDDTAMLINPFDQAISVGWAAVKKDWEVGLANFTKLKVEQKDGPYVQVKGDVARAIGIASASQTLKDGGKVIADVPVFETDVFEKRDGKWLLISHVALLVPQKK
jgi:ketosteroid isomerase-like protein